MVWSQGDPKLPAAHLISLVVCFAIGRCLWQERWWFWYFPLAALAFCLSPWLNPNFLGAVLALGIAIALAFEWTLAAVALAPMLLWTGSRGAIIAGAATAGLAFARRYPTTALTIAVFGGLYAMSLRSIDSSLLARLGIWHDTLEHMTLWGSGWGSFADAYASWPVHRNLTLELAPHAYNDVLQLTFELGLGACAVWLFLGAVLTRASWRYALIAACFALLGLTYFPLWLPVVSHTFALALGAGLQKELTDE
jgi:hypothetical protein